MTLPASGPIGFSNINVELGQPAATNANINQPSYRTLAGIPTSGSTISISNFYGKSNRAAISYTFTSSTANASLNVAAIGGYIAGISDITITVNPGVYLYSTSVPTPGLTLSGGTSGDTVTLVNNGFIMGQGGVGGSNVGGDAPGRAGGTALQLGYPTTVNNTNGSAYIGGGGGGGAAYTGNYGGGGGAGGGAGGAGGGSSGGGGGSIGGSGGNAPAGGQGGGAGGGGGYAVPAGRGFTPGGGGGGGRIFPGVGGSAPASGGSANSAGTSVFGGASYGAGGGGWGAFGGQVQVPGPGGGTTYPGGSGGNAVNLNGRSITWVSGNTSRVYGSVS